MTTTLRAAWNWLVRASATPWGALAVLTLLVLQVQWGLWSSVDMPTMDEAVYLTDGVRLAQGQAVSGILWWRGPLYRFVYSAVAVATRSVGATFYAQRLLLALVSVWVLYALLRRLLPHGAAWAGAAFWAVSPWLLDPTWDRYDFLAAAVCVWGALAVADVRSTRRMLLAGALALLSYLLRIDHVLFVGGLALYWAAAVAYRRLPLPDRQRRLAVAGGLVAVGLAVGALGLWGLSVTRAGTNYVAVFAMNKYELAPETTGTTPMWVQFEREYGSVHSLAAFWTHPQQLARDLAHNSALLVQYAKEFLSGTAWGVVSIRSWRWLLGVGLAAAAGAWAIRTDWGAYWRVEWQRTAPAWLSLGCLAPLFLSVIVIRPYSVYLTVHAAWLLALAGLVGVALVRRVLARRQALVAGLMLISVVLAPSVRDYQGPQSVKKLVAFFQASATPGAELRLLGNESDWVCPYLRADRIACTPQPWKLSATVWTLADFERAASYDYLIYDHTMESYVTDDTSLQQVLAGTSPRWRLAVEIGQYRVFTYSAP